MDELEIKVLTSLSQGLTIDEIEKKLAITKETLADAVINLEEQGFVIIKDKRWTLTEKGKEIYRGGEEELKRLKMEYLHGRVNKEEYNKRKKELEETSLFVVPEVEMPAPAGTSPEKEAVEKIYCPKCGAENKIGYNYCRRCRAILKKG